MITTAFNYITRLVLTLVLPVVSTAVIGIIIAIVISFVAYTMGYDFTNQYQAVLKDGFVFVIPGILSIIGTIMYWSEYDQ